MSKKSDHLVWRRSSFSCGSAACVEVAIELEPTLVHIRDSKDPNGPELHFSPDAWVAFVRDVRPAAMTGRPNNDLSTPGSSRRVSNDMLQIHAPFRGG
jgi:hypothetical protein